MKKLPNFVKWLIIAVVLAAMAAMMVAVNDRASRVEMPMPDNSLGIYRQTPATGSESEKRDGTAGKRPLFASLRSFCRICPFRLTNDSTFCILNRNKLTEFSCFSCTGTFFALCRCKRRSFCHLSGHTEKEK